MKSLAEIRSVKQSVENELLKKKGISGVDIGKKIIKGEKTEELSIRVYVDKKKDVSEKERIPKEIQGIKTDVIQRKFVLHPLLVKLSDMEIKSDTGNYDPLKGGISIGPCRSVYLDATEAACQGAPGAGHYTFVGTLGAFVRDNATNAEMMLSNFHVMCVNSSWSVGDKMTQPGKPDGGVCPTNEVGALQRASLGGQVDCAVASHTARGYNCSIVDIGTVAGTNTATVGMAVRKRGRTTGLTYGEVDTVDLTVTINYCNGLGNVTLTNQIGIEVDESQSAMFGTHGDSGSVVVDNSRKVVGLYFAGSSDGSYGVANPIQSVLSALNVKMCVPLKKMEPDGGKLLVSEIERYKPERYKYERIKPERIKTEQYKTEQYKTEQYKTEQYKRESFKGGEQFKEGPVSPEQPVSPVSPGMTGDQYGGPEAEKMYESRMEQIKPEKYKPEQYKYEMHKPENFKGERIKPERYKPEALKNEPFGANEPQLGGAGSIEDRLAQIEDAIAQISHFIQAEYRPDLSKGSLQNEEDFNM